MNAELACKAVEALEPYARRFMERVERDPGYSDRYFLAWQQAQMILAAYDGEAGANIDGRDNHLCGAVAKL